MEDLDSFFQTLKNFEKSRDKNHFAEYSLDSFNELVHKYSCTPKNSLRISVIGTNGKGSISYFLSKFFEKLGNTGLYTSPHLYSPLERIRVNGQNIPEKWILEFIRKLDFEKRKELEKFSFFEVFTLLSFLYFQEQKCQIEIYEAGLGGRLDATKIASAQIVVLCKVDLDHKEILGETREKILKEKLGIITEDTEKIFFFPHEFLKDEMIYEFSKARSKLIKIIKFDDYIYNYKNYLEFNYKYVKFIFDKIVQSEIFLGENSSTKSRNIIIRGGETNLNPHPESLDSETINYNLAGRMEVLQSSPLFIYDVAHNPDAILNLCNSISKTYNFENWKMVLGLLPDKDISSILKIVKNYGIFDEIFLCNFQPFMIPIEKVEGILILNHEDFLYLHKSIKPIVFTGSFRLGLFLDEMFQSKNVD